MYTETRKSTQLVVNERVRTVFVISAKSQLQSLSLSFLKKIYFIVIYVLVLLMYSHLLCIVIYIRKKEFVKVVGRRSSGLEYEMKLELNKKQEYDVCSEK